jgi:predicted NBD/HSP70 family sugar kinase
LVRNSQLPYWTTLAQEGRPIAVRPKRMREANCAELLRLLRLHMPCSRADLVRFSGLTAPTVSSAIESLQRRGLVNLIGSGASKGGRPPSLLEFNARDGYVFGADIGESKVRLALSDLSGAIVGHLSIAPHRDQTPAAVASAIAAGMERVREEHGIPAGKILEIAAGAPGVTDVRTGHVLSAPNLVGWNDVPLRDLLEKETGVSTTVENDVNLAALGEGWRGVAAGARNFAFIAIGAGVGAGIFINGHLHHGTHWSAGEVGYMLLPGLPSRALAVNRPGALESVIGGGGIERAWSAASRNGERRSRPLKAADVLELAATGDRRARKIVANTAEHLAVAIANMSLVLDMSLVVLGGTIGSHPMLLAATRKAVARNEFACPEIVPSGLGGDVQVQGAVWLALQAAEAHGFQKKSKKRKDTQSLIAAEAS